MTEIEELLPKLRALGSDATFDGDLKVLFANKIICVIGDLQDLQRLISALHVWHLPVKAAAPFMSDHEYAYGAGQERGLVDGFNDGIEAAVQEIKKLRQETFGENDQYAFGVNDTIEQAITAIRKLKPEAKP